MGREQPGLAENVLISLAEATVICAFWPADPDAVDYAREALTAHDVPALCPAIKPLVDVR